MALLAFLVALAQGPAVSAAVAQDRVAVGEAVEFVVTVETDGPEAPTIGDPALRGLEFVEDRERRSVRFIDGAPRRTLERTIVLRALREGQAVIGPVTVTHLGQSVRTDSATVSVRAAAAPATLSERLASLVASARPDGSDSNAVGLTVLVVPDSVVVGQQTDVVLAAWFPRDVRTRIRSQPTLTAPQIQGAWVYQRPTPAGIAMATTIDGRPYDVYVQHLAAFPLTAGTMEIGVGSVSYSLPLTLSFLSREVRMEVTSAPRPIPVAAVPDGAALGGPAGAVGRTVELRAASSGRELPLGGGARVEVYLSGEGNLALWPEPAIAWPAGVRVYPQGVAVDLESGSDAIRGTKTFEYLVVADSTGAHQIPPIEYAYFDLTTGAHERVRVAGMEFVTPASGTAPLETRAPLMREGRWDGAVGAVPPWMVVLVWLGVPMLVVLGRARRRRRPPDVVPFVPERAPGSEDAVLRDLRTVLAARVPMEANLGAKELTLALRSTGVEASLARHAARLRDRLGQSVFGPGDVDTDELHVEARAVIEAMRAPRAAEPPAMVSVGLVVLLALAGPGPLFAQSAEVLYEAGAVRVAADSFAQRAAQAPTVAAHWYNLAVVAEAAGSRGTAAAAALEAARRAPRDATIRRYAVSQGMTGRAAATWVAPVTPGELVAIATVLWLLGWGLLWRRRARPWAVAAVAAGVVGLGAAQVVHARYAVAVAFVEVDGARIRQAPFGAAPAVVAVGPGDPVTVVDRDGAWVRVARGGRTGWVLQQEIVSFQ